MNHSNTAPGTALIIPLEVESERVNIQSEIQQGIASEAPIKVDDVNVLNEIHEY